MWPLTIWSLADQSSGIICISFIPNNSLDAFNSFHNSTLYDLQPGCSKRSLVENRSSVPSRPFHAYRVSLSHVHVMNLHDHFPRTNAFSTISQANFCAEIQTQPVWIYQVVNMFFQVTTKDLVSVHVDKRETRKIQIRRLIPIMKGIHCIFCV